MPVMKLLLSVTVWKSLINLMDISTQLRHGFNETVTVKHAGGKVILSIHKVSILERECRNFWSLPNI